MLRQSIVCVFAVAIVAVVLSSPVALDPLPVIVGWNELLGVKSIFEESVNTIRTKSSDDAVILEQLQELVSQDEVMTAAYLKYRTIFKKTNNASRERITQLKETMLEVARHNLEAEAGKHSWSMAVNQFADMSSSEWSVYLGSFSDMDDDNSTKTETAGPYKPKPGVAAALPSSLNYVDQGIVSKVKEQGHCGTCAMFTSGAVMESADARANSRKPLDLSVQELVDCAIPGFKCSPGGSNAGQSLQYMIDNGITTWDWNPYLGHNNICAKDLTPRSVFGMSKTKTSNNTDKSMMQNLADNGPLAVTIYASKQLKKYGKGVYSGSECNGDKDKRNHAVTLVGYGKENGKKYWLIKNSWDTTWGEEGYVKLQYSVCGVLAGGTFSATAEVQ